MGRRNFSGSVNTWYGSVGSWLRNRGRCVRLGHYRNPEALTRPGCAGLTPGPVSPCQHSLELVAQVDLYQKRRVRVIIAAQSQQGLARVANRPSTSSGKECSVSRTQSQMQSSGA